MRPVSGFLYDSACVSFCLYMTFLQIRNYAEDKDSSAISFRKFNTEWQDMYPAFSICYAGPNVTILPNNNTRIALPGGNLSSDLHLSYFQMLMGLRHMTAEMRKLHFDDWTVQMEDYLTEFERQNTDREIIYKYSFTKNSTTAMPMSITYQDPKTICYTKNVTFQKDLILYMDVASLNATKIIESGLTVLFLIHQKARLINELLAGRFFIVKLEDLYTDSFSKRGKRYEIHMQNTGLEVLHKRSTARRPCNKLLVDEDRKLIHQYIMAVGCVPTFWKRFATSDLIRKINTSGSIGCREKEQFLKIMSSSPEDIKKRYAPPCMQATVLHNIERRSFPLKLEEKPSLILRLWYSIQEYKHIENGQAFDEESLLSMTGGYIGIFLGYSLLQLPLLLEGLVGWLQKLCGHHVLGMPHWDSHAHAHETQNSPPHSIGSQVMTQCKNTFDLHPGKFLL